MPSLTDSSLGTTPSTVTTWSTSADGTADASAATTLPADDLVFSAGTDATGAYAVTLADAQSAGSLSFEDGSATLEGNGGTITLGTAVVPMAGSYSFTVTTSASHNNRLNGWTQDGAEVFVERAMAAI